jgi:hypothetical protein
MKTPQIIAYIFIMSAISYAQKVSSPEEFLSNIYTHAHLPWNEGKNAHKIDFSKRKSLSRYFDDKLVDLLIKDNEYSVESGEVGCLDGDPIYDAQDGEPVTKKLIIKKISDRVNEFSVTFNNLGTKTFIYRLTNTSHGWRISDIEYSSHTTLIEILNCSKK